MRARTRLDDGRGVALVVWLAAMVALVAIVQTALHPPDLWIAGVFGLFIAVGEVVRIALPGGRTSAPLAVAAGLAYALLPTFGSVPTQHRFWDVITVAAGASLAGAIPLVAAGRAPRLDEIARRLLVVSVAAGVFRPLYDGGAGPLGRLDRDQTWVLALAMLGVVVIAGVADVLLSAVVRADRSRAPFSAALRTEGRDVLGLGSAIGATGVLIALAAGIMSSWAVPVFSVPLLLTQFSFRRYASIRHTYLQTIHSLSRVTEVGGYTETGHAHRVTELAVAVGHELGMSEQELRHLEYAALMHDLGQLSLASPIPGGATVMASQQEQQRIADMGAAVIRETGVLDRVAVIVGRQSDPYRRPHEDIDSTLPLAARIIKAANAYDDLVGDSRESSRRMEALERLRLSMAYHYDPLVVRTLAGVVQRRERLGL